MLFVVQELCEHDESLSEGRGLGSRGAGVGMFSIRAVGGVMAEVMGDCCPVTVGTGDTSVVGGLVC